MEIGLKIVVNSKEIDSRSTFISELIEELGLKDRVMAVALNMEIVKKDEWQTTKIKEGDKLELLEFVGGG